jgi:hypothetical protein
VVLVVDQDAVGALGADGAHESLGVTVRAWGQRRCRDDRDVLAAEPTVECPGELGIPVSDEEAELADPVAQIHGQATGVLSDHCPDGWAVTPIECAPGGCELRSRRTRTVDGGRSCRGGRSRRRAARRPKRVGRSATRCALPRDAGPVERQKSVTCPGLDIHVRR